MAKINQATALALAAVFGLATAGLVYYYKGQPQLTGSAVQAAKKANVVVALETISPRATIKPQMLTIRAYAEDEVPSGAVRSLTGAVGRVAMQQIPSGTPITTELIAEKGPGLGMSYNVKDQRRAMTVPIDPVSGVAGYLKPGDRVDVLATYSGAEKNTTRVVLQDVELLAIGNEPASTSNVKEKPNAAADAVTATLGVPSQQMPVLALIAAKAKIQLALRSPDDHAYVPPAPITTTQVFGAERSASLPPAAPVAAPIAAPVRTISVESTAAVHAAPRATPKPTAPGKTVVVTRGTETQDVAVQ